MVRKAVILVLTASATVVAIVWGWCRYWEGVIGGWSIRLGDVALSHKSFDYDLVLSIGPIPDSGWRPTTFAAAAGFGYSIGRGYARFWVPFWFAFILFAACPTCSFVRWYLQRRHIHERILQGRCIQCGYDLAGLTQPRCPECWSEIPPAARSIRRPDLYRLADIGLLFLSLGIGSGIISEAALLTFGLAFSPFVGWADWVTAFVGGLPTAAAYGAVIGLLTCTFGIPLLSGRPIRRIARPLALAVGVVSFVATFVAGFFPPSQTMLVFPGWTSTCALASVLAPTGVALLTCIIFRRSTPDIDTPGQGRNINREHRRKALKQDRRPG